MHWLVQLHNANASLQDMYVHSFQSAPALDSYDLLAIRPKTDKVFQVRNIKIVTVVCTWAITTRKVFSIMLSFCFPASMWCAQR